MRFEKMRSFRVMDLVREARKYPDAIHFEVGEPDMLPPPGVRETLLEAVQENRFAYTETMGISALRHKIADHYRHDYGIEIDPSRVLITPGTSIAFMVAYQLLLDSSDRIGMSDPGYPCYRNFAYMVDAEPVFIPVDGSTSYRIEPEALEKREIKALHISSPANPTGTLYTPEALQELIGYCDAHGIRFISDELYHGLVYDQKAATALQFSDRAIVINGFSKYFCMPGMRIGWIIVPEALIRPAEIIAQNLYIATPTLSQYAALEAFDYGYLAKVREIFKRRRDYLFDELGRLFRIDAKPEGAFYLWCDVSEYTDDSTRFSERLLREAHIAVTPGEDFGKNGTRRYLRFSYTRDIDHMRLGVERMRNFLASL